MSKSKAVAKGDGGRQSAYVARNRAALLISGREILAKFGPSATIEEIAGHAQVSPTTIYKYFESREGYLSSAQLSLWEEWEEWALNSSLEINDPLRRFINPILLLIRVSETHPQLAQALEHSTASPDFIIEQLSANSKKAVKALAKAGEITQEDISGRYLLFSYSVVAIVRKALKGSPANTAELKKMLVIALGLLGVNEGRAKKAITYKLNFE